MKISPWCGKQYGSEVEVCAVDGDRLKPLACAVDEYLGRFLADLPYDFEETPILGPNARSMAGDTPLHIAAIRGDVRAIELLLASGADINAPGEDGFTALHYAAQQNQPAAVRLLLARGADAGRRDKFGQLPREIAEMVRSAELLAEFNGDSAGRKGAGNPRLGRD